MKFKTPKFTDVVVDSAGGMPAILTNDANKLLTNDGKTATWGISPTTILLSNLFSNAGVFAYTIPNWVSPTTATITLDPTFPSGTTLNSTTGVLSVPNGIQDLVARTYTITVFNISSNDLKTTSVIYNLLLTFPLPPIGQWQYTGEYGNASDTCCATSWVAPSGVTSVNVMVIGGGGGGYYNWANCGGAGGGMSWANCIPVTSGQSYCIIAGNGGCWDGGRGGKSCFPGMVGCGGGCGCCSGLFTLNPSALGVTCGGYGMVAYPDTAGGGGGGAGYSNGCCNVTTPGYAGIGGGGGSGTGHHSSTYGTGGGGGTGICGQGSSGTCGNAGYGHGTGSGGAGGSGGGCGKPGQPWSNGHGNGYACGGAYGGGGGGGGTSSGGGWGGPGAVRIIWGSGRSWPSTNTGSM